MALASSLVLPAGFFLDEILLTVFAPTALEFLEFEPNFSISESLEFTGLNILFNSFLELLDLVVDETFPAPLVALLVLAFFETCFAF